MAIDQALGLRYSLAIVPADQRLEADEASVLANHIGPIFRHCSYSKGRNWPVRSLAISGERSGSSPSQSRHWNLRPPVLRSKNRIGLRHVGQIGGGVFLGTTFTLDLARGSTLTVTDDCRGRAVIPTANVGDFNLSVRSPTWKSNLGN
jgi:hypothetical protein